MPTTYRLLKDTHVVVTRDGDAPEIVTLPEGSIITLPEPPSQDPMVPVQFGSITVKMFAADLEWRAELVSVAAI